jgi:MtN3 and saliva related transmembrane protein
MDITIFVIGIIATSLTTVSMIPQAVQTIKTKRTDGISLWMYILFVIGVMIWIVYGIVLAQKDVWAGTPVWVGNAVTLVFAAITLGFKINNVRIGREPLFANKNDKSNHEA